MVVEAGHTPEQFRDMTPRDAVLVIRKYHQRDYKDWRRAAYIVVNHANLFSKKKYKLDRIMPPWESAIAGPDDKAALKQKRTEAATKRAEERYQQFYGNN